MASNADAAAGYVAEIVPGPEATEDEIAKARAANAALFNLVKTTAEDDKWFSFSRWAVILVLAIAIVASTCALIISAVQESTWAAAGSAAALVGTIAVAGWMNPLQTIERDVIIRRWSDVLLAGWAADIAGTGTPRAATKRASGEFLVLCSAYAAMANKSVDAVSAIVSTKTGDSDSSEPAADLAIAPIPSQTSKQGEKLKSTLHISATGGSGKYKFSQRDLPGGLDITEDSGDITGEVEPTADAKAWIVTVTATEVTDAGATPKSVTEQFVWNITSATP